MMLCSASKLELDLMPDHRVVVTIRCRDAYEAAVLFEDVSQAAQSGSLVLEFEVGNRKVVKA
jgi:hypothetical protein